ncbi:TMhelix containing protein [Vibrio phage 1.023.O._10N.222.51.B4]|nr:TMhelix containing protein [Vibrio phage 1.023.O._10N.222.51.B4]
MMNKYSKNAQGEWVTDWETKRAGEAAPLVKFSLGVIAVALIGLYVLDGIADWAVGL